MFDFYNGLRQLRYVLSVERLQASRQPPQKGAHFVKSRVPPAQPATDVKTQAATTALVVPHHGALQVN